MAIPNMRVMRPAAPPIGRQMAARSAQVRPAFTSADDALIEQALNMQVPVLPAQEPDRYDVKVSSGGKQVLTPAEQKAETAKAAAATAAVKKARYFENMQYLSLLAQSAAIVTEITPPINGNAITPDYRPLFTNNTNGAVRVQVFADFVNPGVGVVLSLTQDASDIGKVDELSLTANGKTESISVMLMPTFSLFTRDRDATFFPMQANDVVRVRVFDPAKLLAYDNLYPVQK